MDWIAGLTSASLLTAGVSPHQELASANWWVKAALQDSRTVIPTLGPGLEVTQQTHGTFRLRESVWGEPMRLAGRDYARGIGTHATSEVRVYLPEPAAHFRAIIGIDDNPNTRQQRGSVVFVVADKGGAELFRSEVLRGDSKPQSLEVGLSGASSFVLRVLDADDGPAHDQADWCDARVTYADGCEAYLDDLPVLRGPTQLAVEPPFSLRCGGRSSREFLPGWKRLPKGLLPHGVGLVDEASGLRVVPVIRRFDDFPAVDWLLELTNEADTDTPTLDRVLPLDLTVNMAPGELVRVHHYRGSTCELTDFLSQETALAPGDSLGLAPHGGRSSNGTLPFFNVDWGNAGVLVGIGWSGQWEAGIARTEPGRLRLTVELHDLRTQLHPGERIRLPRILLLQWQGTDPLRANNLLRRLLLKHYCPRANGKLAVPPIAHNTAASILLSGKGSNEQTQMDSLRAAADIGCEAFWLDAYWFPKGFPRGVGNWTPRLEDFPNGLRPLSEAAHKAGMKFVLWFEPERVARDSQIATEHPEYCLEQGDGDLLYNLADPKACQFMTDLLCDAVEEHGVDVYREDFNIDPLRFWRAADEPDRQGMTEIRWVEGLYRMWDGLLARYPHLEIDNCASGGRRIDLETLSRSYALWRSDYQDGGIFDPDRRKNSPLASQVQNVNLGLHAPFSTSALWSFDPYSFRSTMSAGVPVYLDLREPTVDRDQARAAIAELKELRKFFLGDLYPLTPVTTSPMDWCAYQFDRPDLGEGIALFCRRRESPYLALDARLKVIDSSARYEVAETTDYAKPQWTSVAGSELVARRVQIAEQPGCVLLRYRQTGR